MKINHLPVDQLARIFRATQGDKDAQAVVTMGEVMDFRPADTFAEFLEINQCPIFEEILR